MVYVDDMEASYGRMKMCHMIADTDDELHAMAASIGLKREWFQGDASTPHYDLSISRKKDAIARGAMLCDRHEFVAILRRLRAARLAAL